MFKVKFIYLIRLFLLHLNNYYCRVVCEDETHKCQKLCFQECKPCTYPKKCILECGHELEMECHRDPDEYECTVEVLTTLPCNHTINKPCHVDVNSFLCSFPCEYQLETCGHVCDKTCHIKEDPNHSEVRNFICKFVSCLINFICIKLRTL